MNVAPKPKLTNEKKPRITPGPFCSLAFLIQSLLLGLPLGGLLALELLGHDQRSAAEQSLRL